MNTLRRQAGAWPRLHYHWAHVLSLQISIRQLCRLAAAAATAADIAGICRRFVIRSLIKLDSKQSHFTTRIFINIYYAHKLSYSF